MYYLYFGNDLLLHRFAVMFVFNTYIYVVYFDKLHVCNNMLLWTLVGQQCSWLH